MPASSSTCTSSQRLARARAGHVRVRELVDDGHGGMAREDGVGVHLLEHVAPRYAIVSPRNRLEPLGQRDRVGAARAARSSRSTTSMPRWRSSCASRQHLVGLADAGGVAEKDLQPSARGVQSSRRQCGKTRTSMPSASRISRSSRLPVSARAPRPAEVVADEELRDAVRAREVENRGDRIAGRRGSTTCGLLGARQHDVARERRPILRREVRLVHVDGEQLAVEPIGVAPAAGQHRGRVGARRHADEDTLLRAPRRVDAIERGGTRRAAARRHRRRAAARARAKLPSSLRVRSAVRSSGGASTTTTSSARFDERLRHGLALPAAR